MKVYEGEKSMKLLTQLEVLGPLIASLVAIGVSLKTNHNANKIQKEINKLQLISEDKQRLIEVISSERVEWINKVRKCFAGFNTDAYVFSSSITQVVVQKIKVTDDMNSLIPKMINQIEIIELYLNPTEIVMKKQTQSMDRIIKYFTEFTFESNKHSENPPKLELIMEKVQNKYLKERKNMMYFQQVILKVEWKRVKLETEKGRQISSKEMHCIFEEVAKQIDEEMYSRLLKDEFKKKSYCRKDLFNEI